MKTIKIKYLIVLILLFAGTVLYPQTKKGSTYYPNNVSIEYSGTKKQLNSETDDVMKAPYLKIIDDISELRIINDSIINVSNYDRSDVKLNINKISSITIKSGSNLLAGLCLGATAGLAIGYAIGKANDPPGMLHGITTGFAGLTGIITGGLIGAIVGGNISGYEQFDLDEPGFNKKKEMERILRIDKKIDGAK